MLGCRERTIYYTGNENKKHGMLLPPALSFRRQKEGMGWLSSEQGFSSLKLRLNHLDPVFMNFLGH